MSDAIPIDPEVPGVVAEVGPEPGAGRGRAAGKGAQPDTARGVGRDPGDPGQVAFLEAGRDHGRDRSDRETVRDRAGRARCSGTAGTPLVTFDAFRSDDGEITLIVTGAASAPVVASLETGLEAVMTRHRVPSRRP
jgi:hypothetical protein